MQSLCLYVEPQLQGNLFEVSLLLGRQLVDLQRRLDLLRCHLLSMTIFAIDADALFGFVGDIAGQAGQASSQRRLGLGSTHVHFLGQRCVLLDLLLRVPEPLVYLVLFQVQLV